MHTTDTTTDTNADTTEATATEATDTQTAAADRHAFTPITTQEDLDKVIGARLARERDKYADYDDLKVAAGKLAEAEARLAQIDAQAALDKIRNDVAQEAGVPAGLLRGSTKDELAAHAAALAEALKERPSVPVIPTQGATPSVSAADSARRAFAHELFGSK
nr:MAG TPA: Major head protein [Caudoviricetes sp.]